jgi:hypothetical protein
MLPATLLGAEMQPDSTMSPSSMRRTWQLRGARTKVSIHMWRLFLLRDGEMLLTNMGHARPRVRVAPDAQVRRVQHAVDLVFAEAVLEARVDEVVKCVVFQ